MLTPLKAPTATAQAARSAERPAAPAAPAAARSAESAGALGRDAYRSQAPKPQPQAAAQVPMAAPLAFAATVGTTLGGMAMLLGGAPWPVAIGVGVVVAGHLALMQSIWRAGSQG